MSRIKIEMKFNATVSNLMAVLQEEDPERPLDAAGAMQLLAEVRPRTAKAYADDMRGWLTWWQGSGRGCGRALHLSLPAYLEFLVGSGRKSTTCDRCQHSIRRVMALLGFGQIPCRMLGGRKRRFEPAGVPFGQDQINQCIQSANPDDACDVKSLAGLLVLYETRGRCDQFFAPGHGSIRKTLSARKADLRRMPDGVGHLKLAPMKRGEAVRTVLLSPLAMEWIVRAHVFDGDSRGPLLADCRGGVLSIPVWKKWTKALISRSGIDARGFSLSSLRLGRIKDLNAAGFTDDNIPMGDCRSARISAFRFHDMSAGRACNMARLHDERLKLRMASRHRQLLGRLEIAGSQMSFPGM